MDLAYVSVILILAHSWLARGADCHAEKSMRSGHSLFVYCLNFRKYRSKPIRGARGMTQCT